MAWQDMKDFGANMLDRLQPQDPKLGENSIEKMKSLLVLFKTVGDNLRDNKVDQLQEVQNEISRFDPHTAQDLLSYNEKDGFGHKQIKKTELDYLTGSLDMLYYFRAILKNENEPIPKRLDNILDCDKMISHSKQHDGKPGKETKRHVQEGPKRMPPKQVNLRMIKNSTSQVGEGLLKDFVKSLNFNNDRYKFELEEVNPVSAGSAAAEPPAIMSCMAASRVMADINGTLALFYGNTPAPLTMILLHPKAHHVEMTVTTQQKLGSNEFPNITFIDIVFWDGKIYECDFNKRAREAFVNKFAPKKP